MSQRDARHGFQLGLDGYDHETPRETVALFGRAVLDLGTVEVEHWRRARGREWTRTTLSTGVRVTVRWYDPFWDHSYWFPSSMFDDYLYKDES